MEQVDTSAVAGVWQEHRRWSRAAGAVKRSIVIWRGAALAAGVCGAVLATAAVQVGPGDPAGRSMALLSAVALAVVPVVRVFRLGRDRVEAWTRVRATSEALKAQVYLYLAGAQPYDGPDRDQRLRTVAATVEDDVADLAGLALSAAAADTPLPAVRDGDDYAARRVRPQIDGYYRAGAARHQRRLTRFRTAEFVVAALGAVLGAVAATTGAGGVGAWVAVVTVVGASLTAHVSAARYEHLVVSYLATARQLRALLHGWEATTDRTPAAVGAFVRACEDAIARENQSWLAAWTHDDEPR
ncbi:DUF4231 domain-containing protein [Micromonospora coxensis]|uniref:SMODS and SLOG-associating 2TM effector domain-containing protein n=1 Tax=Micromonospora coxensis TaxID=356852 RepID=A0A1C5HC16_9ACTN|nr:DUF4231 domain-containing protein [Micromonospora coxensis]SCG43530.1 Protein of unknown function [Micromonospora coxensis]